MPGFVPGIIVIRGTVEFTWDEENDRLSLVEEMNGRAEK
jgi:hypothetical protein